MQDTISISATHQQANLDTLKPIYIFKDSTVLGADADMDYGFVEYTAQTLKDYLSEPILEESLLKEKTYYLSKPLKLHEKQASDLSQTWLFSIIVFFFLFLAIGVKLFRKKCLDIIHSTLSLKSFEILLKSSNPLVLLSSFLFVPLLGLLIYSASTYWLDTTLNQIGYIKFYLLSLAAIFAFFFVKIVLIKFFGFLFRCNNQVNAYITNILVYMSLSSILLILPVFASLFTTDSHKFILLIISIFIFLIITFTRTLRGLYMIIKLPKFFNIYLFCYLCTLEIAPLLLLYRSIF